VSFLDLVDAEDDIPTTEANRLGDAAAPGGENLAGKIRRKDLGKPRGLREQGTRAHGQPELLGQFFKAGTPQDRHAQLLGLLVDGLLGAFPAQALLELTSDFVERPHLFRSFPVDADDVQAERRLHEIRSRIHVECESHVFELCRHSTASEPSEIAAGGGGSGVV
jgi:hypothetical protein